MGWWGLVGEKEICEKWGWNRTVRRRTVRRRTVRRRTVRRNIPKRVDTTA